MYWLLDNATYFYVLLGIIALGVLYLGWITRKKEPLIACSVIVVLLLILWLLNFFIVTDRQQIHNIIYDVSAAVGEKRYDDIIKHLSSGFSYQASNRVVSRKDVREGLIHVIQSYGIENVQANEIRIDKVSRAEKLAEVRFNVGVSLANGSRIPVLCRSKFKLEDSEWRMSSITYHPAFSDSERLIQFPIP